MDPTAVSALMIATRLPRWGMIARFECSGVRPVEIFEHEDRSCDCGIHRSLVAHWFSAPLVADYFNQSQHQANTMRIVENSNLSIDNKLSH